MNKKEQQAVEKLFADRQKATKDLLKNLDKSRKRLDILDKGLHKSIFFSGLFIGMMIIQIWYLFFGGLNLAFTLLQIDLILLMLIFWVKSWRGLKLWV